MQQTAAQSWKHLFYPADGIRPPVKQIPSQGALLSHTLSSQKYYNRGGGGGNKRRGGKMKDSLLLQYSPKSRGCKSRGRRRFLIIFLLSFAAKTTHHKTYCSYSTQLPARAGAPRTGVNAAIPKVTRSDHPPPSLATPGFLLV